jgi:hypothetical protein
MNKTTKKGQAPHQRERIGFTGLMSRDREVHLEKLLADFKKGFDAKYRKGSAEHKERLWELGIYALLLNSRDEVHGISFPSLEVALAPFLRNLKQRNEPTFS